MLLPTEKPSDNNLFEIEKIVTQRYNKKLKKKEYLVKWMYYPPKFNQWIPADDLIEQQSDNEES